MKCILCNERNASTRCEGCQQLYCLPCMIKHHEELAQRFQLLTNVRNELKQSLDMAESASKNNNKLSCIIAVDRWEQEIIQRIREIAAKTRITVNEIMVKNMTGVRCRLDQLSEDIQQRQKEGNYLENDIDIINTRLNQLKNDIKHVSEKIQVDSAMSDTIQWDTLIYIIEEDLSSQAVPKLSQTDSKPTKERKKKLPWYLSSRFQTANDRLSRTTSEEQIETGPQTVKQVTAQTLRSNSPLSHSNIVVVDRETDQIRRCIVCNHHFEDLSSTGLCFNCGHSTIPLLSRSAVINRSPPINVHSSPCENINLSILTPLSPRTIIPLKVVCPHCYNLNLVIGARHEKDVCCTVCQTVLRWGDDL